MNESIGLLYNIAQKRNKLIIGLMSGTSLDGLDIALCEVSGTGRDSEILLRDFKTVDYPDDVIQPLKAIVSVEQLHLQDLCLMHSWLGDYHADLINQTLREWEVEPANIDCIASHGQTIYHAPIAHHQENNRPNSTLQIIDGDHIARQTGILTISDFRQKHTAAGGEGAPMVALTDQMLYSDKDQARLLLNIGGIANFTYLPVEDEPITTDTGPGNTLIDNAMQQLFDLPYDEEGAKARGGNVQPELLKAMLDDSFFEIALPRSTGPELFNMKWVKAKLDEAGIENIADKDLIATLTWLSAQSIADGINEVSGETIPEIYISGGGIYNTQLVEWIEELLDRSVHSFEEIGFNPDAKEAVCFAVLANETLSGKAFTINPKQNAGRNVNFGKISLPV